MKIFNFNKVSIRYPKSAEARPLTEVEQFIFKQGTLTGISLGLIIACIFLLIALSLGVN
jgi:hypothetical protein